MVHLSIDYLSLTSMNQITILNPFLPFLTMFSLLVIACIGLFHTRLSLLFDNNLRFKMRKMYFFLMWTACSGPFLFDLLRSIFHFKHTINIELYCQMAPHSLEEVVSSFCFLRLQFFAIYAITSTRLPLRDSSYGRAGKLLSFICGSNFPPFSLAPPPFARKKSEVPRFKPSSSRVFQTNKPTGPRCPAK